MELTPDTDATLEGFHLLWADRIQESGLNKVVKKTSSVLDPVEVADRRIMDKLSSLMDIILHYTLSFCCCDSVNFPNVGRIKEDLILSYIE